jgi:TatD DNase family protein
MALRLYDAHNHLHDERLRPKLESILDSIRADGEIRAMVVNGSCEADWQDVLELAQKFPWVIPSFEIHPWYVKERSARWQENLTALLDKIPSAIGEIGLDRWIKDFDSEVQEEVFIFQLRLAAQRKVPVSIHCLQAWGRMLELLQANKPSAGFVLHSFGGSKEMIPELAELDAYFSLPGYFAHARKTRQREAFLEVPRDRLLIETDAPDQSLPPERVEYELEDSATGKALNHPANLGAVYRFAAELLGESIESLAQRVEGNFKRLFGNFIRG